MRFAPWEQRMKKFTYRMQSLLDIAYKMEEQAKIGFANAQARVSEEEKKLRDLQMKRMAYEQKMREAMAEELDLQEIRLCKMGIEKSREEIRLQVAQLQLARRLLEEARQKVNEAMIERKTHEKLREKKFKEYMQEYNAEESKEIDQLVSYTFGRKIVDKR